MKLLGINKCKCGSVPEILECDNGSNKVYFLHCGGCKSTGVGCSGHTTSTVNRAIRLWNDESKRYVKDKNIVVSVG